MITVNTIESNLSFHELKSEKKEIKMKGTISLFLFSFLIYIFFVESHERNDGMNSIGSDIDWNFEISLE